MESYLAWRKENPGEFNPTWCAKHWAPCPVGGLNGLSATIIMTQRQIAEMPIEVRNAGTTAMNSWLANQVVPYCCKIGDEEVVKVWKEAGGGVRG